jgi:hypothetical protein
MDESKVESCVHPLIARPSQSRCHVEVVGHLWVFGAKPLLVGKQGCQLVATVVRQRQFGHSLDLGHCPADLQALAWLSASRAVVRRTASLTIGAALTQVR